MARLMPSRLAETELTLEHERRASIRQRRQIKGRRAELRMQLAARQHEASIARHGRRKQWEAQQKTQAEETAYGKQRLEERTTYERAVGKEERTALRRQRGQEEARKRAGFTYETGLEMLEGEPGKPPRIAAATEERRKQLGIEPGGMARYRAETARREQAAKRAAAAGPTPMDRAVELNRRLSTYQERFPGLVEQNPNAVMDILSGPSGTVTDRNRQDAAMKLLWGRMVVAEKYHTDLIEDPEFYEWAKEHPGEVRTITDSAITRIQNGERLLTSSEYKDKVRDRKRDMDLTRADRIFSDPKSTPEQFAEAQQLQGQHGVSRKTTREVAQMDRERKAKESYITADLSTIRTEEAAIRKSIREYKQHRGLPDKQGYYQADPRALAVMKRQLAETLARKAGKELEIAEVLREYGRRQANLRRKVSASIAAGTDLDESRGREAVTGMGPAPGRAAQQGRLLLEEAAGLEQAANDAEGSGEPERALKMRGDAAYNRERAKQLEIFPETHPSVTGKPMEATPGVVDLPERPAPQAGEPSKETTAGGIVGRVAEGIAGPAGKVAERVLGGASAITAEALQAQAVKSQQDIDGLKASLAKVPGATAVLDKLQQVKDGLFGRPGAGKGVGISGEARAETKAEPDKPQSKAGRARGVRVLRRMAWAQFLEEHPAIMKEREEYRRERGKEIPRGVLEQMFKGYPQLPEEDEERWAETAKATHPIWKQQWESFLEAHPEFRAVAAGEVQEKQKEPTGWRPVPGLGEEIRQAPKRKS